MKPLPGGNPVLRSGPAKHAAAVMPATVSPPPSRQTVLTAERLTIAYQQRPALCDVSLQLAAGRITAVVGPSGCGKSSFLMAVNRLSDLIPGCRVTGRLRLGATDVLHPQLDVVAHRRRVGMIFQKPNPFPLSVWDNLELPLKEHGVHSRSERAGRIERALREVGLWDEVADRLPAPALQLSGGQQQRLCLARALVLRPEVLLLDEPCSALDPVATAVVEERIAQLRGEYTVILVTHNLAQARRLADDLAVFWMEQGCGRLIEFGPAEKLFTQPQHAITRNYLTGQTG